MSEIVQSNACSLQGGCFCRNIRYEILKEGVLKAGVCHCRSCQHLTGGSSYPFMAVKTQFLNILGNLKEFTKIGASGKEVHCGFCADCGSTLFGRSEVWPYFRTVSASSLDDPEYFAPRMHAWTENAQNWVLFSSDMQQFQQNPPVNAPLKKEGQIFTSDN